MRQPQITRSSELFVIEYTGGAKRSAFEQLTHIIAHPKTNSFALATELKKSNLTRAEIVADDYLLMLATQRQRVDLVKTLLTIPGWSFQNNERGYSVLHIAAQYTDSPLLYYLLLASPNPARLIDSERDRGSGQTVREFAINYRHPLAAYLQLLTQPQQYPKAIQAVAASTDCSKVTFISKKMVSKDYPLVGTYLNKKSVPNAVHELQLLAETTRYLVKGSKPLRIVCIPKIGSSDLSGTTRFFIDALKNEVKIISASLQVNFHNPLVKDDVSLEGFQKATKTVYGSNQAWMSVAEKQDYANCLLGDRLACLHTIYSSSKTEIKLFSTAICNFLEKGILIVSAGNEGVSVSSRMNMFTINWPCSARALANRIIVTRAEYTEQPLMFQQYSPGTNYGSECYLMPATAFIAVGCQVDPLCASAVGLFDNRVLGTSYSAPQVFGIIMQTVSLMNQLGIEFIPEKVIDFLNQGCIKPQNQEFAKCIIEPQTVFLSAARHYSKQTSVFISDEPPVRTVKSTSSLSSLGNIFEGAKQGIASGVIASAIEYQQTQMKQKQMSHRQCSQQAFMLKAALFYCWIFSNNCYRDCIEDGSPTVNTFIESGYQTGITLLFQEGMKLIETACYWLSKKANEVRYKNLSNAFRFLGSIAPMSAHAAAVLPDPVQGISSIIAGAVTQKVISYSLR